MSELRHSPLKTYSDTLQLIDEKPVVKKRSTNPSAQLGVSWFCYDIILFVRAPSIRIFRELVSVTFKNHCLYQRK
jgi:hypothetical protein